MSPSSHRLVFCGLVLLLLLSSLPGQRLRLMTWNVENGVGPPESESFLAVRETIQRLRPDVIVWVEVDAARDFADLKALLAACGYPTEATHLATSGTAQAQSPYVGGDYYFPGQVLALSSKFPLKNVVQIGRGHARRFWTRYPLLAQIDVPSTDDDPYVVAVHFKAGTTQADRYRKGVELYRTTQALAQLGISGQTHHLIMAGDFNDDASANLPESLSTTGVGGGYTFSDSSRLPSDYDAGPGLPSRLPYATFPNAALASVALSVLPLRHADESSARTFIGFFDSRLDYVAVGPYTQAIAAPVGEVYYSRLEHTADGLPKEASLPAPTLSARSSDHLPLLTEIELTPRPVLQLSVSPTAVREGESTTATVSLSGSGSEEKNITVRVYRSDLTAPVLMQRSLAAGQTTSFLLPTQRLPRPQPDRLVTLIAEAPGAIPAYATLRVKNLDPSGLFLISQYTEAATGSSPKAIELSAPSPVAIDFSQTPLRVWRYTNGDTTPTLEARLDFGLLPAGKTLVIGDAITGDYLVTQGLLSAPPKPFAEAENGTLFQNSAGEAVFLKDTFSFNGNDALEVILDARLCDVFGTVGQDPGTAWTGSGVSTANQNLERLPSRPFPLPSFSDPSRSFQTNTSSALSGFGQAPNFFTAEPYLLWAQNLSWIHSSPLDDADFDGQINALEFWLDEKNISFSRDPSTSALQLHYPHRDVVTSLTYQLETSTDLIHWNPIGPASFLGVVTGTQAPYVKRTYSLPTTEGLFHSFYRWKVILPP